MIVTAKLIAIFLGLALTAFTVSTIVLAVQKANLDNELQEVLDKLDFYERSTTTPSSTSSSTAPSTTSSTAPSTTSTTTVASTTTTTEAPSPTPINYRLPTTMYPSNYDLYLHPDVATGNFTGQVEIRIRTTEATNRIVLHSLNLNIENVWVTNTGSATLYVIRHYLDLVREQLIIDLSENIAADKNFYLGIIFSGAMQGKIVGLYSSSYLKDDGSRKTIATSKFEPTYARQAFPCFDEPSLKATFDITLVYPNEGNYHALSNMDLAKTQYQNTHTEAFFNTSVPMSTYLACFIVSDFANKDVPIDTGGIGEPFTLRAFATPEQIDKVDFALEVGKTVIEYYIQYFQIPYPLPKLDMAAIPDFVSGAMEHWGLVTYRETSLLYDESLSSTVNRQSIAAVIAHEFAHMWFGNLVTMAWWNDLWLNEGFAKYIEHKGTSAAFPEWKMEEQYLVLSLHSVLSLDATLGSHPIIQTVETPDQITEIFDTITYYKGASIIRMLEGFLGEDIFRQGVTNYLNEYKFKNAVTDNFLTEIDKIEGLEINVTEIMRTWTEQMGLPVVMVERTATNEFKLTQKRFFSNPNDYDGVYDDSPFGYTWSIPITYKTSDNNETRSEWFYYYQNEITITLKDSVEWIKFNIDQVGFYRVNYPDQMWETLANELIANPGIFSVSDRASLLNDAFSLADSTQLSFDIALDMTKYLSKEADFVPWSVAASKLTSLKRLLMSTASFLKYKQYSTELIKPIYEDVTWTVTGDHLKSRLRVTVLNAACSLGLKECLNEASTLFDAFLANPNTRPNPDIRDTVYFYGMQASGNEEKWERMWEIYLAETDATEQSKLRSSLSAIQVPWILTRFINLAWNESYVRGQDYLSCLQSIASNAVGEPLVWDYVRENWEKLVDRFGINERNLGNMIPGITGNFMTQTKYDEMEAFFAKYPEAGAGTAARVQALENVKNNIVWLEQNAYKIDMWLDKQVF